MLEDRQDEKMALAVSSCRPIGVLSCRLGSYRLKPRMDWSSPQSPRGQDLVMGRTETWRAVIVCLPCI